MRCLYCGKELALLKRWTGGGEFCSDAHRQRYQEEYNQLALNRLLQAKPPSKPEGAQANEPKSAKPSAVAESPREAAHSPAPNGQPPARIATPIAEPASLKVSEGTKTRPAYHEPAPAIREVKADPAPVVVATPRIEPPAPVYVEPPPEEPAPADLAGFFVELPLAAFAEVPSISHPDLEFLAAVAAALPNRTIEPLNLRRDAYQLETAGLLTFEPHNRASNYTAGSRERKLEVRDFVRTNPIVEIDLSPAGETGLETSSDAMDILIFPQPPQGAPVLWQESYVRFSDVGTELGDLGRLSFTTTGFSDEEKFTEQDHNGSAAVAEAPPAVEESVEEPAEEAAEEIVTAAPIPDPTPVVVAAEIFPELREPVVEPKPTPVIEQRAVPVVEQKAEPEPVVEPAAEKVALPDLITKPLPLVLHVSAPAKGKPVQVFSSATNAMAPQVPRSTSLPLRPVIVFGPTPVAPKTEPKAEQKVEAKPEAKKPVAPPVTESKSEPKKAAAPVAESKPEPKKPVSAPVRPDPRLANVKLRAPVAAETKPAVKAEAKPEVKEDSKPAIKVPVSEPAKEAAPVKQVAKTETPIPARPPVKLDSKQDKKLEAKEPVKVKEEVRPAPVMPAPLAAPYPGSNDLGLPRLNMQSSSGFLGQLPAVAKIGIVAVLIAGLGSLIAFSSKSGGAAPSGGAGTIVAGSALPVGQGGWITDWGAAPGVRSTRQISILRSSQTLTDYRIDMNGQIESKAIGWVFRAQDPKNFYVTKLEIVKPGLEPTVALIRFAIINGEEQAHAQLPLPMKVRLDTMYKIRFDAVGNHFTTYVQDEKVDDWTDDHIKTGGVGFYRERGEDATLKGGMNVVPLTVKK